MSHSFALAGQATDGLAFGQRMKNGTFLVVDDFDTMRKVTINQLKQLGAVKILEASNGAEALRILQHQPITMILSDWNMPVMSGLDLLLEIRGDTKLTRLPFLMITAEAERERVLHAIHSGVSELLVKPYTAARLAERIERALDWKPRPPRPVTESAGAGTEPVVTTASTSLASEVASTGADTDGTPVAAHRPTLLIVDDTPDNLTLLSSLFKQDYRVRIAHNGEKALTICQSDTPPDLVLLDIMMPGMDGFAVAQAMRGHPSSEHIPVIFVTAMTDEDARQKAMSLGAVDFVTKPIDPVALTARVRNFMRYVELHRQLQADYDEMMQTERLKDDVERITRHDMKGPLAGVIGLVQGLSDAANLTAEQKEHLRMVEETTLQVLDMINLSNELYKIETGRFELHAQGIQVAQILRRVVALTQRTFAAKQLNILISAPIDRPEDMLLALGDPMLCYSLFQNLIKNACEAAPPGSTVSIGMSPAQRMNIVIENGGAVPEALRERFFEKYATAGKQGGTGLGTYSAKLLTEAQGGVITMETSDETQQTRITVSLPLA